MLTPNRGSKPDSVVIEVGHQTAAAPVSYDMMYPTVTCIHAGDTVLFMNKAIYTPHTVTFAGGDALPAPMDPAAMAPTQPSGGSWGGKGLLSSGMLRPGESYAVTFNEVGVYDYLCIMHPLMQGQVVVMPAGAPIPSAEDRAAAVMRQQADADAHADALTARYAGRLPNGTRNPDGTVTWDMTAGTGAAGFDIEQFYPARLLVSEGDSVTFTNRNQYEPHFCTFPTSDEDESKFWDGHEPNLGALMTPMGGNTVDGSQLVNAGAIMPQQGVTFSFPKAGSYPFDCYLHDGNAMDGAVIVQPKGALHVYLNGEPFLASGQKLVYTYRGLVYLPLAEVARHMGCSMHGDDRVFINGRPLKDGWDVHVHGGSLFVPALAVVEAFDGRLEYSAATRVLALWL